jgi:hypothetical protein
VLCQKKQTPDLLQFYNENGEESLLSFHKDVLSIELKSRTGISPQKNETKREIVAKLVLLFKNILNTTITTINRMNNNNDFDDNKNQNINNNNNNDINNNDNNYYCNDSNCNESSTSPLSHKRIECYFPDVNMWFRGTVIEDVIHYDDGDEREVDRWEEIQWRYAKSKGKRRKGMKL